MISPAPVGMGARRFEGKIAIVTGAGRKGGIGEAIATRLAREGADVAVVDLCREKPEVPRERFAAWEELQAVADSLAVHGGRALPIKCDVTDEVEVAAMASAVASTFGAAHLLFNNAGGGTGAGPVDHTPVWELALEDWRYTQAVSLDSAFLCSKHVSPIIARSDGGAIVNTVSISAHHGVAGLSAYAAAKYGVIALTRNLAIELAAKNIRVNAFSPGITLTPYVQQRFEALAAERPGSTAEDHVQRFVSERVPLGRAADPSEMAAVAAFLASDDSSFMTGQTLQVDGGMRV